MEKLLSINSIFSKRVAFFRLQTKILRKVPFSRKNEKFAFRRGREKTLSTNYFFFKTKNGFRLRKVFLELISSEIRKDSNTVEY